MNRNVTRMIKDLILPGKYYNLNLHEMIKSMFEGEKNAQLYNNIIIKPHRYRGYNIISEEKIFKGQLIAQVPFNLSINSVEIENYKDAKILKNHIHDIADKTIGIQNEEMYENLYNHLILIYKSLIFSQNKSAELNQYVNSFPKDINSLVNINEENKKIINSISLKMSIDKYCAYVFRIMTLLNTNEIFVINEDLFHYLFCITNSKKFYVNTEKGKVQCIIPLFDILKHSFVPNCEITIDWDNNLNKTMCNLYCVQDINKGESITICYEPSITNTELALKYGFVDKNNPNKIVEIPMILDKKNAEIIFDRKLDRDFVLLIEKINSNIDKKNRIIDNINKIYNLKIPIKFSSENFFASMILYLNKFDQMFLSILRIALLNEKEIEQLLKSNSYHNFSFPLSPKNEQEVLTYLNFIFSYLFEKINKDNNTEENFDEIFKNISNKDENDKYLIKVLQNEEKMIIKKNIEYVLKKLDSLTKQ